MKIAQSAQRVSTDGYLDGGHSNCLRALRSLEYVELDSLILVKRAKTARLDLRMVNEHILRTAIGSDKAEALIAVEPLYGSLCHLLTSLSFTMDAIRSIHDEVGRLLTGVEDRLRNG
jgi:hypothetical protein